jgi:hypothetical protein
MLTLLLSLSGMIGLWAALHLGPLHMRNLWSILLAFLLGLAIQISATLLIRRKITALMNGIQARISERTITLRRKYEQLASRGGNVRFLMDQARKDQDAMLVEALESSRKMDPYGKWSIMLDRQINAIRVQFLFQLKRYEEVDALLPKTLLGDPVLCCMKMCRQYQRGELDALEKTYNKYRKKFKRESVLIYATYSWMLLRKKMNDKALQVLVDGKTKTEDDTLAQNWEYVANGKVGSFSNANFGEPWYALMLEEPKQPKQPGPRQMRPGAKWRR